MAKQDFRSLDEIATGEISASLASDLIKLALRELTEQKVQKLYTVLRAWVWKALNERRRDAELRKWHAIIHQTSAYLEDEYLCHAERIRVLHELIYESISVSEVLTSSELMRRSHVKEVLRLLISSPEQSAPRLEISNYLRLRDSNLSRVLTMLLNSGLIERTSVGKAATFRLTREGIAQSRTLVPRALLDGGRSQLESSHGAHTPKTIAHAKGRPAINHEVTIAAPPRLKAARDGLSSAASRTEHGGRIEPNMHQRRRQLLKQES